MAQMAVRDHIRHTMDLQHQPRCNYSWSGARYSAIVYDCDGASFSNRFRERFETRWGFDGKDWGIDKREWL
jgi:hypothetical protein